MHRNIRAGRIQAAASTIAAKHTDIENPDPKAGPNAAPKVTFVKHHSPKASYTPTADKATMEMLYGGNSDVTGAPHGNGGVGNDQAVGADNHVATTIGGDFRSDYEVVNLSTPPRE
jgi:hypothetical protein